MIQPSNSIKMDMMGIAKLISASSLYMVMVLALQYWLQQSLMLHSSMEGILKLSMKRTYVHNYLPILLIFFQALNYSLCYFVLSKVLIPSIFAFLYADKSGNKQRQHTTISMGMCTLDL